MLTEPFVDELVVGYSPGPPYGRHLLTWAELAASGLARQQLRRAAAANLYAALDRVGIHGQPPALMLSFDGLESSVLLAHQFWEDLAEAVPGELVVGAPARDVVIFTGAQSGSGLRRLRRAVDRMFFAGGAELLSRELLVRRQRRWEVFHPPPEPGHRPPPLPAAPRSPVPVPQSPAVSRSPVAPQSPAIPPVVPRSLMVPRSAVAPQSAMVPRSSAVPRSPVVAGPLPSGAPPLHPRARSGQVSPRPRRWQASAPPR